MFVLSEIIAICIRIIFWIYTFNCILYVATVIATHLETFGGLLHQKSIDLHFYFVYESYICIVFWFEINDLSVYQLVYAIPGMFR